MINLRYHIVSVTAVFLALGIGIALGSTLIERATVDTLNDRLDSQVDRLDRTDGENADLQDELKEIAERSNQLTQQGPALFGGHLTDRPVVVITVQGTDEDLIELTQSSLRQSGAVVPGVLRITSRWNDLTVDETAELSAILGREITNGDIVRSLILGRLADELLIAAIPAPPEEAPSDTPTDDNELRNGALEAGTPDEAGSAEESAIETASNGAGTSEVGDVDGEPIDPEIPEPAPEVDGETLAALIELGYIEFFSDTSNNPLPPFDARYVVVVDRSSVVDPALVLLPLIEDLATQSPAPVIITSPLVEAEDDASKPGRTVMVPGPLVADVRDTSRLGAAVTTVDNATEFTGQAAVVLGLANLYSDTPAVGHYGRGKGSTALVPPVEGA